MALALQDMEFAVIVSRQNTFILKIIKNIM
jgi:hypothetical protein